jgi:hypothetical protein
LTGFCTPDDAREITGTAVALILNHQALPTQQMLANYNLRGQEAPDYSGAYFYFAVSFLSDSSGPRADNCFRKQSFGVV